MLTNERLSLEQRSETFCYSTIPPFMLQQMATLCIADEQTTAYQTRLNLTNIDVQVPNKQADQSTYLMTNIRN